MFIQIVTAYDMCGSQKEVNENCTMLTPVVIGCVNFNYTIYNSTNWEVVENASLNLFSNDIYAFNFTQPEGDYVVKLCDGTTREVISRPERENMIIAVIILMPMLLGFILLWAANGLGEDHAVIRLFMFLLSPIMFIVSLHFGVVSLVKFYNFPELQDTIGDTIYWFGIVLGVIITYFIIYLFIKMVHTMAEKKNQRINY